MRKTFFSILAMVAIFAFASFAFAEKYSPPMQEETTIILLGAGDDAAGTIAALVADGEFFGLIVVDCRQNDFQEISPQLNKIALAAIPELEFDYSIKPPTKNRKFSFEPANYSPPDIVNFNGLSFDARARAKI